MLVSSTEEEGMLTTVSCCERQRMTANKINDCCELQLNHEVLKLGEGSGADEPAKAENLTLRID